MTSPQHFQFQNTSFSHFSCSLVVSGEPLGRSCKQICPLSWHCCQWLWNPLTKRKGRCALWQRVAFCIKSIDLMPVTQLLEVAQFHISLLGLSEECRLAAGWILSGWYSADTVCLLRGKKAPFQQKHCSKHSQVSIWTFNVCVYCSAKFILILFSSF